jgi:phosphoserine phosphatase RsbU/P
MASVGLDWYALRDCRILVVDDNQLVRSLIGSILNSTGLTNLAFAVDGEDALAQVDVFRPDLIVLDIMMPRVDGFAVLERLRSQDAWLDVPVLVLTAADDHEIRGRVFMTGATDFVSKPINRLEFLARIKVHLSAWVLLRQQAEQLRRIDAELKEAQRMQMALLPSAEAVRQAEETHGLTIRHHFESSMRVGGDYWSLHPIDDRRLGVLICDFSGHGVSAAMNTVRLHTLLLEVKDEGWRDAARFVRDLNGHLIDLLSLGQFATFLYGIIDREAGTFTYATAATPDPFLGHRGKGMVGRIDGSGLPLGLSRAADYETTTVPFPPGSFLFLYSDALYEGLPLPKGSSGRNFLFEQFSGLVASARGDDVLKTVIDWFFTQAPPPPRDDLTAIWIERRE